MFLSRENFKELATEFFLIVKNSGDWDEEATLLQAYLNQWDEADIEGRANMFANFATAYGKALTDAATSTTVN